MRNRTGDDEAVTNPDVGAQVIRAVGIPSAEAFGVPTITFREIVRAAAEAIGPTALTAADVRMIVAEVVKAQPRSDWRANVGPTSHSSSPSAR